MSSRSFPPAVVPFGLLAAAGFLSSSGARVVDPLLHVVATDFGVDVPFVSIIVAAFTLPYGVSQILLGPLGDRFGKLRMLLAALTAYSISTVFCAFAPSLPWLTVARACAGMASAGLIPMGLAYIADNVVYTERQVAMSRLLNGVMLAQVLAGPLGGIFGEYLGWRGVFLLLSAAAIVAACLLARRLARLPVLAVVASEPVRYGNYALLFRGRANILLMVITLLDGVLFSGTFPFVAPYLHLAFELSYLHVGLLLSFFGVGIFGYTYGIKKLMPLLGERGFVLAGALIAAAGMAGGMLATRWEPFIVVEAMLGLGYFMLHGVVQARATEMLPAARGTAVSGAVFMLFLGQSIGALLVGFGIERFGYVASFSVDAAGILLLGLGFAWHLRRA